MFITFSGQIKMGKDQSASYLCRILNERTDTKWETLSIAKPLKEIFCKSFGFSHEEMDYWKRKTEIPSNLKITVREALINIGDGFRQISPDVWIRLFENDCKDKNVLVPDARYLNEVQYVKNHGGIAILLYRPGHENNINNASEQELMPYVEKLKGTRDGEVDAPDIPFDLWLVNDGNLDELYYKIEAIVFPYIVRKFNLTCQ